MSRDNAYVSPGVYLVSCIGSDHQPKNPSPPPVEEPPYKYCATCARKMPDDDDEEECVYCIEDWEYELKQRKKEWEYMNKQNFF